MSQLTCDVKTCPASKMMPPPPDSSPRIESSLTSTGNERKMSYENQTASPLATSGLDRTQREHHDTRKNLRDNRVAYDVLDSVETAALNTCTSKDCAKWQ